MYPGYVVLIVLASFCFFLSAIGVAPGRVNLIALGLFFWVLTLIVKH